MSVSETRNRDPIERLLAKLDGVKPKGDGWIALCPAHPDNDPSLSISRGGDGRALLHCFAGCETKEIMAGVGMRLADLFPVSANGMHGIAAAAPPDPSPSPSGPAPER